MTQGIVREEEPFFSPTVNKAFGLGPLTPCQEKAVSDFLRERRAVYFSFYGQPGAMYAQIYAPVTIEEELRRQYPGLVDQTLH